MEDSKSKTFNIKYSDGIEQQFTFIKDKQQNNLVFSCGPAYSIKSTVISPSVKARRTQIIWKFLAAKVNFTLKMDLFGCPSEPFEGQNPQCGPKPSFYRVNDGKTFECVHLKCPLSCGSHQHYYKKFSCQKSTCDKTDLCISNPCDFRKLCVDYLTYRRCYCLKEDCSIESGAYVLFDKDELNLFDTVRLDIITPRDISSSYTIFISGITCRLDFKSFKIQQTRKWYFCSRLVHKITKGEYFTFKSEYWKWSYAVPKVILPQPFIYVCLRYIEIKGASHQSFDKRVYSTVEDIRFTVSNERGCGSDFEIIKYKWTFSHFESETYNFCISDDSFEMIFSSSTDNGVLVVKKQTLLGGYFKVCLQVDGIDGKKSYSEVNVTCGYFRVKPVPLELVIKPPGLHQTVLTTRRVRLDASDSKDPNSDDNSSLSYEWLCEPVNSLHELCVFKSQMKCMFPHQGPILTIPENTLPVLKTFNITVRVSKPRIPSGTATVIIFVSVGSKPNIQIICRLNCNTTKVLPSKLLALEVNCENCGPSGLVVSAYVWKLSKQSDLLPMQILPLADWVSKSPTGYNKKTMVLPPGTLQASCTYQFDLHIFYKKNESVVKVKYRFTTNKPPIGGSCSVDPTSGQALITKFTVSCPGYKDNDSPLTYSVYLKKKGKSDTLLYHGNEDTTSLILPAGPPQSDSWLQLTVYISDSLDTSTMVSRMVQVRSPRDVTNHMIELLAEATDKILQEKPSVFLQKSLVIVEMLRTVKPEEKEQKKNIRERLLNNLKTVKAADKEMLLQMSDLADGIISQENNISSNMQNLALTVSIRLAGALKEVSTCQHIYARNIAKKQCNTLVSLMVKGRQMTEDRDLKQIEAKTKPVLDVLETVGDCLLESIQSIIEGPVNVQSDQISLTVDLIKATVDVFHLTADSEDDANPGGSISFPNDMKSGTDKPFDLQMMIMKTNPFQWSPTAKKVNLPVMKISVKKDGKSLHPSNLSVPADIFISANLSNVMEEDKIYTLNVSYDTTSHKVKNSSTVRVVIPEIKGKTQIVKIVPINSLLKLEVVLGASESEVSFRNLELHGFAWPVEDGARLTYKNHKQDPHLLFLPEDILGMNHTDFYLAVRVKKGQILHDKVDESRRLKIQIGIQTFTVECSYWSEAHEEWRQDGCMVSPFTTVTTLHCWCSHLTVFSGGIFISPNTVDPIGATGLFLTFFDNPVVVTFIVAVWILYALLLIWLRRVDQKDLRKTGITMLADNIHGDHYVYMICVVTGWWAHAGTTSRVSMYLCGESERSEQHDLIDSNKKLFIAGAENWFLLKTSGSLGQIKSVVIWHDNSGEKPSWYLNEIVVKDVQTEDIWHCLYNKWLRVHKGNGTPQADIPAVENATFAKKRFYQFMQTMSRDLRDEHIWLSIFSKPPTSKFTHVQRLTCALSLVLSMMLTSIMFHGIPQDDPEDQIDFGDFHFSLVDFVIGIESALIVFPIIMIIILLFKLIKPKPHTVLKSYEPVGDKMKLHEKKKDIFSKLRLPWYFVYVAYFVAVTTSLICSYFVMLYGLEYGYNKSVAWLISFFTSFFQSALVTEPVKMNRMRSFYKRIMEEKHLQTL
ncbi:polycystic kidney disease protein 1-like 2 isoform X2 [Gigantopelta aegis]|uniref:polycystic kidney disease protein 1-like 2 isoform X2 n=1 Tax=Gigantopelta aegis TaxID=1735272 RepID=UPI001B887AB3|nr:polycystic kidney disease protein 1-like 2 isoform X2 [Gigantopelta aegis]